MLITVMEKTLVTNQEIVEYGWPSKISGNPKHVQNWTTGISVHSKFINKSTMTYKFDLPRHCSIAPIFHVSRLKPVIPGQLATNVLPTSPPAPLDIVDQTTKLVKSILYSRRRNNQPENLVKWDGYGPAEQSWVPTPWHPWPQSLPWIPRQSPWTPRTTSKGEVSFMVLTE